MGVNFLHGRMVFSLRSLRLGVNLLTRKRYFMKEKTFLAKVQRGKGRKEKRSPR
jgi:hypothetical protein